MLLRAGEEACLAIRWSLCVNTSPSIANCCAARLRQNPNSPSTSGAVPLFPLWAASHRWAAPRTERQTNTEHEAALEADTHAETDKWADGQPAGQKVDAAMCTHTHTHTCTRCFSCVPWVFLSDHVRVVGSLRVGISWTRIGGRSDRS